MEAKNKQRAKIEACLIGIDGTFSSSGKTFWHQDQKGSQIKTRVMVINFFTTIKRQENIRK